MGFTESAHRLSLTGHARGLAVLASARSANGTGGGSGGLAGILRSIEGTVGTLSHTIGGVFSGVGGAGLVGSLTKSLLDGFFRDLLAWVASGAASLIGVLGTALSASTEPMLAGSAFRSEFDVMAVLSAGVALPLLAVGAIQAIVRQEPGALLRRRACSTTARTAVHGRERPACCPRSGGDRPGERHGSQRSR